MLEILSDFKEMGVKAITFSGGGEPLIYSHIEEVMKKALELVKLRKERDFIFILNDDPELAVKVGADGVHLGQEDMSIDEARKITGNNFNPYINNFTILTNIKSNPNI